MRVLVDTSAWIEALRPSGDERVREAVARRMTEGEAVLSELVLLELWNGARGVREQSFLRAIEADLEILPTTPEVWALASDLARSCRRVGTTVPATDLVIAACARYHGVDLLHRDEHFTQIERVLG